MYIVLDYTPTVPISNTNTNPFCLRPLWCLSGSVNPTSSQNVFCSLLFSTIILGLYSYKYILVDWVYVYIWQESFVWFLWGKFSHLNNAKKTINLSGQYWLTCYNYIWFYELQSHSVGCIARYHNCFTCNNDYQLRTQH